jgi:hypothetical protein
MRYLNITPLSPAFVVYFNKKGRDGVKRKKYCHHDKCLLCRQSILRQQDSAAIKYLRKRAIYPFCVMHKAIYVHSFFSANVKGYKKSTTTTGYHSENGHP